MSVSLSRESAHTWLACGIAISALPAFPAAAQPRTINIPSEEAAKSIPEFARQDSGPKKLPPALHGSQISDDDIAFVGERGDQVRAVSLSAEDTGTKITLLRSFTKPPAPAPTVPSPTQ